MNLADRIQNLRKTRGISQEELADQVGVSRQAVSKWESEQSAPDLEKVILMSEYFGVTTDYLLKGIEPTKPSEEGRPDANIFVIVATVLNFIGLVTSCAVWYERQNATAFVIGLVFMALGCMVFGIGVLNAAPETRARGKRNFWTVNIWLLAFLPLSFCYNVLFRGMAAPYPLWGNPLIAYPVFWLIYVAVSLAVVLALHRKRK